MREDTKSRFTTRVLRPKEFGEGTPWGFAILPKDASAKLPRRGRTTVDGTINGRINDACDMLASGKKRVCCFDPSGYYSKAFMAPQAE